MADWAVYHGLAFHFFFTARFLVVLRALVDGWAVAPSAARVALAPDLNPRVSDDR